MKQRLDSLYFFFLKKYSDADIEDRIKAQSILSVNFAMLLIAAAMFPFALDETIWLLLLIGGAIAGFLISIFLLKKGHMFAAALLHISINAFIVAFLHLYVSDSYDDSLTFIILSIIFTADCMLVATISAQVYYFAAVAIAAQVLAPFLNLNGKLHLSPAHQIENIVLFGAFFLIISILIRNFTNILLSAKTEADHAIESESKYRLLAENVTDVIWTNDLELNMTYISPSVKRFRGYTVEEVMKQKIEERLTPESVAVATEALTDALSVKGGADFGRARTLKLESICKDGSTKWSETKISFLRNEDGEAVGILGVGRDITDQIKTEEEKKLLQVRLNQSQKMEAVGTLAGGIAHDFNNILGGIFGYAQLAQLETQDNPKVQKYIDQLCAASNRAKGLVKQILAFSRQSKSEKIPTDIRVVIKEALKLLRASIPTTIDIQLYEKSDAATVAADPNQIHQLVMNLCTNAYHAMNSKDGSIILALADAKIEPGDVAYQDIAPGNYLEFTVADSGRGMDEDIMARIFEPYFTTKGVGEGTGMGLAVVHGIVKDHGGGIKVKSELGVGTTFTIWLPLLEGSSTDASETSLPTETGNETILFVDDEEILVDVGKEMLEGLGYVVVTRTSSFDALEAIKLNPAKYDLVITDMTMPKMTGDNLAREIKKIRKEIPIILCTGFSEKIIPARGADTDIHNILMKPISLRDLAKTVRDTLDGAKSV